MSHDDFMQLANGVRMPRILYGTAWKQERTATCVTKALSLGFRGIDTACQPKHYFEPGVGHGIASFLETNQGVIPREALYVQSKFTPIGGQDPRRIPYDPKATLEQQVAQSLQTSLRNLGTQYLDGLVLHSPLDAWNATQTVWNAMEQMVDAGSVRQIGISNCYDFAYFVQLHRWARIKPAVLQNRFYAATGYDIELRAFCREQGIVYQSFWTLTANPDLLASELIESLAIKYERSPAQVLFRLLTHQEVVPLTGTQSEVHMRDDLAIFSFELTLAERTAFDLLIAS